MALTFEEIKRSCKPGDILIGASEREFVGFTNDNFLVAYHKETGIATTWIESQISDWTIKPKMKTIVVERWFNVYPSGFMSECNSKEIADKYAKAYRIDCFHFRKEYQLPEEEKEQSRG